MVDPEKPLAGSLAWMEKRKEKLDAIKPGLYQAEFAKKLVDFQIKKDPETFTEFINDLKNGSSDRDSNIVGSYDLKEAYNYIIDMDNKVIEDLKNGITGGYANLSDEELEQMVKYGEEITQLIGYYNNRYAQLDAPKEKEYYEKRAKMVDSIPKNIPRGCVIRVVGRYINEDNIEGPYYEFVNALGKKKKYEYSELRDLEHDLSTETKKDYDFRETSVGKRTRRKNVTSSKPVKVQKGKSIKVSNKERSEKVASSKKSEEFVNSTLKMLSITKSCRKFKEDTNKLEKDGRNWLEKLFNIHEKSK